MPSIRPLAILALLTLTGCPAFFVERGPLVTPAASLEKPGVLPQASRYVELAERWRRECRVGIGGHVEGILWDPMLAGAWVSHEASLQGLRPAAITALLDGRWDTLYGPRRDRVAIDLDWRFDAQFISNAAVLDPERWRIALSAPGGERLAPLAASVLSASKTPRAGYWEGRVRLWFPASDPARGPLYGPGQDWLRLELDHPSGSGELNWRFHPQ